MIMSVERTIRASPDRVFDVLADHENYREFPLISSSSLSRPGTEEPGGVGAVRRIGIGPAVFDEEITAFDRPHRIDYLIIRVNLPIRHEGATVVLTPTGGGTTVRWTSTMHLTVPVAGALLDRLSKPLVDAAFSRVLAAVDRRLTGGEPAGE
jgi:uncharacterized protein YndB with AHSA1/START domain